VGAAEVDLAIYLFLSHGISQKNLYSWQPLRRLNAQFLVVLVCFRLQTDAKFHVQSESKPPIAKFWSRKEFVVYNFLTHPRRINENLVLLEPEPLRKLDESLHRVTAQPANLPLSACGCLLVSQFPAPAAESFRA